MFSVRTTSGSVAIIIGDLIICYLFFGLILPCLSYSPEWLSLSSLYGYLTFSVLALVVILSLCFTRLYSFMEYIYPIDLTKRIIPAFALSFVTIATMGFFIKSVILLNWRLLVPLVPIYGCVFVFRYLVFYGMTKNRERILIVGVTTQAREIIKESLRKKFRGYDIAGIITSQEGQVGSKTEGVPVLGLMEEVRKIVHEHMIDSIVVTLRERRGKLPVYELLGCKVKNIRIEEGFTFYEKIKRKIIIDEFLKPSWFIFEAGFFHTSIHGFVKRTQGMIVSFILLTFLSPILFLIAILIKLESHGPVFFQQERVGRNNKPFRLLKFRSMCQNAEKMSGPAFARKNDPRITRIGMVIRKIRLDEVPQFINIFKGDMDLVGPRPERTVFVSQLEKIVPYYNLRHVVRPGLTGWAQENYPYGDSFEDSREKLKYDLYYVKHFSWYLDLLIVFLTVREVLFRRGR